MASTLSRLDDNALSPRPDEADPTEALFRACGKPHSSGSSQKEARAAISAGAEINTLDASGHSPLFLASQNGQWCIVGVLLDHGARPGSTELHMLVNHHLAHRQAKAGSFLDQSNDELKQLKKLKNQIPLGLLKLLLLNLTAEQFEARDEARPAAREIRNSGVPNEPHTLQANLTAWEKMKNYQIEADKIWRNEYDKRSNEAPHYCDEYGIYCSTYRYDAAMQQAIFDDKLYDMLQTYVRDPKAWKAKEAATKANAAAAVAARETAAREATAREAAAARALAAAQAPPVTRQQYALEAVRLVDDLRQRGVLALPWSETKHKSKPLKVRNSPSPTKPPDAS